MILKIAAAVTTIICFVVPADGFNPILSVNSCTRQNIILTLTNVTDGGLVYIQGTSPECRQHTYSGFNIYTFNFTFCKITLERTFRIVVQKKSMYHTSEDKIIPVTCSVDLSSITVNSVFETVSVNEEPQRHHLTKPTAVMTLISNGNNVRGRMVSLEESLTLKIELLPQYRGEFDIRASSCIAATLQLIFRGCPTDINLFPGFSKSSRGGLTTTFKAFVPTDQIGQTASINIFCTLDICRRTCNNILCSNQGRSKGKGNLYANLYKEQLYVNTSLSVSSDDVQIQEQHTDDFLCVHKAVFTFLVVFLSAALALVVYLLVIIHRNKSHTTSIRERSLVDGSSQKTVCDIHMEDVDEESYQYHFGNQRKDVDEESYQYYYGGEDELSQTSSLKFV